MKIFNHILFLIIAASLIGACKSPESSTKKTETQTSTPTPESKDEVGELKTTQMIRYASFPDGYSVKNDVSVKEEYEAYLFTNKVDFDKIIGFGKTSANNSILIDFDEKNVFAVTRKASNEAIKFSLHNVLKSEGVLNLNFQSKSLGVKSFASQPVYLLYLDKKDSGSNCKVLVNGKVVKLNDKF